MCSSEKLHKKATENLLELIPESELRRVITESSCCDIDLEFLGFIGNYMQLSAMIPKNWTIVDLGCAYSPQCYFFMDHNKYIGIDVGDVENRFSVQNTVHHSMTIDNFVNSEHFKYLDLDKTFFICQYVPDWFGHDIKNVISNLKNVFSFYPKSR